MSSNNDNSLVFFVCLFVFTRTQTEGEPETQRSQVTYWKVEVQVFQPILGGDEGAWMRSRCLAHRQAFKSWDDKMQRSLELSDYYLIMLAIRSTDKPRESCPASLQSFNIHPLVPWSFSQLFKFLNSTDLCPIAKKGKLTLCRKIPAWVNN